MKTFKELTAELLQNPEVRAEYERLRPQKTRRGAGSCDHRKIGNLTAAQSFHKKHEPLFSTT
jgi:hypothetical protein